MHFWPICCDPIPLKHGYFDSPWNVQQELTGFVTKIDHHIFPFRASEAVCCWVSISCWGLSAGLHPPHLLIRSLDRIHGVRNPRRTCTRCTLHGSNGRSDSRAISFLLGGTNHSNRHISRAYHWPGAVWHVVVCIWVHIPACYLALELPGLLTTRDNRIPGLISPTVSHLHTTSPRIRGTDIAGRSHMAHA